MYTKNKAILPSWPLKFESREEVDRLLILSTARGKEPVFSKSDCRGYVDNRLMPYLQRARKAWRKINKLKGNYSEKDKLGFLLNWEKENPEKEVTRIGVLFLRMYDGVGAGTEWDYEFLMGVFNLSKPCLNIYINKAEELLTK